MRSTVPTANPPPVWKDETVFSKTFLSFLVSADVYLSDTEEVFFTAGSFISKCGKITGVTNNNNDCPVLKLTASVSCVIVTMSTAAGPQGIQQTCLFQIFTLFRVSYKN